MECYANQLAEWGLHEKAVVIIKCTFDKFINDNDNPISELVTRLYSDIVHYQNEYFKKRQFTESIM